MKTTMRLGIIESLHLFQHPCFGYFWPDLVGTTNVSSFLSISPYPFLWKCQFCISPYPFLWQCQFCTFICLVESTLEKTMLNYLIFTYLLHIHVSRINQYQNCLLTPLADLQNLGKQINRYNLKLLGNKHHGCEQKPCKIKAKSGQSYAPIP